MAKYRFLLVIPLLAALFVAWYIVSSNDGTKLRQQQELMTKAAAFAEDKVYVKAVPLAEEAYAIDTDIKYTDIENTLMEYYRDGNYTEKYYSLLAERIRSGRADRNEYMLLAEYYYSERETADCKSILKNAILRYDGDKLPEYYGIKGLTGVYEGGELYSDKFTEFYERISNTFSVAAFSFDSIGFAGNGFMTVQDIETGLWGIYSTSGNQYTEHIYEQISDVSDKGFASVKQDGEYLLVSYDGTRYALGKDDTIEDVIRTEGSNQTVVMVRGGKMRLCSDLVPISKEYDFIGAPSEGYRAVCIDGAWSFSGGDDKGISGSFKDIKLNSHDEAMVSGRAFVKTGGEYKMIDSTGNYNENSFEDAKPFAKGGNLAAVKQGGKWGFADKNGRIIIDCRYDDAHSCCSENIGLVKCDDGMYRFIDLRGNVNEKFEFAEAGEFYDGFAAVRNSNGKLTLITVS